MRNYLPHIIRTVLSFLLAVFSITMIYSVHQSTQAARRLARTSLESTALAVSTAAENALRSSRTDRENEIRSILSDRVIAYALIASQDGAILFHTNDRLVGAKLPEGDFIRHRATGNVSSRRITLGTGIPAYEFNYTLHQPDGREELLRLTLHTADADLIAARAERMWWLVGLSLFLIWTAGVVLERVFTRYLHLQSLMEEQNRMTLIGQMSAVLAHEIRNALASVKGYAQWINEKLQESQSLKPATEAILQGTGRIESLVDELLVYARLEHYKLERVDLKEIVDEAAGGSLSGWQGKTEMDVQPGKYVLADREKLIRVLVNGLRNAVDAMSGKGTLRIASSSEGRWVNLRIEDTGPGITDDERRRLFTPFYTTKTEGTGLGLAYAKKVVDGMKGNIALENRDDKQGAILSIRLPAA